MQKKILLYSSDPGGANVIIPLVSQLFEKSYNVRLFGRNMALRQYIEESLMGLDIMEYVDNVSLEEIEAFLKRETPDFIITDTADDFAERYIWKAAEYLKIPSFAILDQWSNYGLRFSKYNTSNLDKYDNKDRSFQPEKIIVMDEYAKDEAIKEGLEETRLIIAGHPYFESLLNKKDNTKQSEIIKFRESLGVSENNILVTYASEPIDKDYKLIDFKDHWGYTEKTILVKIIEALDRVAFESDKKIKLVIKLHPRDDEGKYSDIIPECKSISIKIVKNSSSLLLIMSSDLICGISSMFLIESVILNKPVLSVIIGLKRENPFILDRRNIIKSVLDEASLISQLKSIVIDEKIPECNFNIIRNPVNNIISEMEKYL